MSLARDVLAPALIGAGATAAAASVLRSRPPGGAGRWERRNFAGRDVSLLGGAAVGAGAVAGPLAAALVTREPAVARTLAAAALAAGAGAGMGLLDDLGEGPADAPRAKGLRGHLGALARGQVTTGSLKIVGIGAGALLAAALVTPGRGTGRLTGTLAGAALVAGTANLHNLFDLRPGRSLKVATAVAAPLVLAAAPTAATGACALGVVGAALPDDLAERTMLGDTGANAVGALVGTALAAHPSRLLRGSALAAVVALTLASERVSFSAVIDSTPVLHRLDDLGRRAPQR